MATETKVPDAVLDSANYTTLNLADIDEDPDSPDASYGTWDGNGNTSCRVSFGTPSGNPTAGAGLQEFRALIRRTGAASLGWSLQLWENGAQVSVLATGTLTTSSTVVSGTWNASSLSTADGSLVECRLEQTSGGTGGGRQGIEVGAVEWNATYTAGVTVSPAAATIAITGQTPVVTGDPTIVVTKSVTAADSTTRNIAFDTASAGDLLIAIVMGDGAGTYTWAGTTSATELTDTVVGADVARLAVAYRIATGGETNIDATCSASERSAHFGIRIPAALWHGTTPPEIFLASSVSTANPNPPNATPTWGSAGNIWIAGHCTDSGNTTAFPTGYDDHQTVQAGADVASAAYGAIAIKTAEASSDDPSAFTISTTDDDVAYTIVVRPPVAGGASVSPSVANIAVTGQTSALIFGTRLSPTAASVAVTGQTPNVVLGTSLAPAAGSIDVTGQTPTIELSDHQVVAPAGASVGITGQTSTIEVSDHISLSPDAATVAVSGDTPSLIEGSVLAPAAASVAVSGQTSTIEVSDHISVAPQAASIAITGQTPTVTAGETETLSPAAASVAITGQAPTIELSDHVTLSPTAASVAITAMAPDVVISDHQVASPTPASVAILAFSPDVIVSDHQTVFPSAAAIALTGSTPTITNVPPPSPDPWQVETVPATVFARARVHFERD